MAETIPFLHRPIPVVIDGKPVSLLTVGHLCHVLRRSRWSLHYWVRIGLFPAAPFYQNADNPHTLRRLYPESFVDRIAEIADRGYIGKRLDRDQWEHFRIDVERAYRETVSPLLGDGVTDSE